MNHRLTARLGIAGASAAMLIGGIAAGPASAKGGGGVQRSGSCTATSDWKLKAKPDDGRLEVEGEIDSNRSGQRWHWTFKHNGSVSATGSKETSGRSGSFEVQRRMANLAGRDHFVFRATHQGQVCRGTITI
jgi:hypothetical protein